MIKFALTINIILLGINIFCQDSAFLKNEIAKIDSLKTANSGDNFEKVNVHGESEFFGYYQGIVYLNKNEEIEKVLIVYAPQGDSIKIFCIKNKVVQVTIKKENYYCIDDIFYNKFFSQQSSIKIEFYKNLIKDLLNLFSPG